MRFALAAVGFRNGDLQHNKNVIIRTLTECAGRADIALFGEAFLQGFYAATFDPERDDSIAVTRDDPVIREIRDAARRCSVAVSFGFIEKAGDFFYSSQMSVDSAGEILDVYRRISPGWKEDFAGERYREGDRFHTFPFRSRKIAVALCGDLWYEENVQQMRQLNPDLVFWPVYTDFAPDAWNSAEKHEYAAQAGKTGKAVLYVNSVCADRQGDEIARGGAALFADGKILREIPSGEEGVLFLEI